MFTKQKVFLLFQIGFLAAVGLILVFGDRSQPKVTGFPAALPVNQPIIINFDRPVTQKDINQKITLIKNGQKIPGTFSWSSRSVAFIHQHPLDYGTTYTLSVAGITDLEGHVLHTAIKRDLTTNPARFLFIKPDYSLNIYDLASGSTTLLSQKGQQIISYTFSQNGQAIATNFRTGNLKGGYQYGIELLKINQDNSITERTTLQETKNKSFVSLHFCNGDNQILSYEDLLDGNGVVNGQQIVSYPFSSYSVGQPTVLLKGDILADDLLECSKNSDQFIFSDSSGNLTLSSISAVSQKEVLGRYQFLYGFSPVTDTVMLGDISPQTPSPRVVYAIGEDSLKKTISDPTIDTTDPAYNADESLLAVSENADSANNPYQVYQYFQISLLRFQSGTLTKKIITPFEDSYSNTNPSWSSNGIYLTYLHSNIKPEENPAQAPDSIGTLLEGTIVVQKIDTTNNILGQNLLPAQKLDINGSTLQWLP